MTDKNNLLIILLLFLIIIISCLYYPIFAIEYFSIIEDANIEDVDKVKKCLNCTTYKDNNSLKENILNETLNLEENNDILSKNKTIPVEIEKENSISDILSSIQFSPSCCPSSFTSSNGCACTTPQIVSFLETRGNNKKSCV
tara:strand:+ start:1406 stop:1831 length:426 start_codon:yes stop_codon:yes gene_type:complete